MAKNYPTYSQDLKVKMRKGPVLRRLPSRGTRRVDNKQINKIYKTTPVVGESSGENKADIIEKKEGIALYWMDKARFYAEVVFEPT